MVGALAALKGQMIAAESERQGLEQIYQPENYRVRMVKARIAELRKQLEKLGGTGAADPNSKDDLAALYPPLRSLPIIGVQYANLYREAKTQETVYEMLMQQYELAKVQEAKETPTVKVLDAADVPETRSFPPRLLIIGLGILGLFLGHVFWVLGKLRFDQMDPHRPVKALIMEVAGRMRRRGWRAQERSSSPPDDRRRFEES
jgi:uncharacterized protein involved in exopolysaccharide biosynthesis